MGSAQARAAGPPPDSARPLQAFVEDAWRLAPPEFEASHGSGFLLLTAAGPKLPKGSAATEVSLFGEEDPCAHTADLSVLVYALRPGREPAGHLLTIGRAPNNDVVIPDRGISRLHAIVKRDSGGGFLLLDAGSTNGTTVNGLAVPVKDRGPATALRPGATVRLGQLDFTFVDAAGLRAFATEKSS
jgi:hypothetical protein